MSISSITSYGASWVDVHSAKTSIPDLLQRNAAILADNSGQYTREQKLAAYQYLVSNWAVVRSSSPSDQIAVGSVLSRPIATPASPPVVHVTLSDDARAAMTQSRGAGP